MNHSGFQKWDVRNPDPEGEKWTHNRWPFRVADILAKQVAPDQLGDFCHPPLLRRRLHPVQVVVHDDSPGGWRYL